MPFYLLNAANRYTHPRSLIPSWTTTPIPNFTLSASGLLALADLRTISRRTALVGGASWVDAFVLAPGLHYQQACDELEREAPIGLVALPAGALSDVRYAVKNTVTASYLVALCKQGAEGVVTLDVGLDTPWDAVKSLRKLLKRKRVADEEDEDDDHDDWHSLTDVDWLSHLFYLASPLLTVSSLTFMTLLADWWGLAILLLLMFSRILNIWALKNRTSPPEDTPHDHRVTEYQIDLGGGHTVRLRGPDADLQALVTHAWMKAQSQVDGYLEAAAKMMVYMSAALGGNMTQAGAFVLVGLLLVSAALLGLSNAHARGFRMHGRYALPETEKGKKGTSPGTSRSSTAVRDAERGVGGRDVTAFPSVTAS
ncbi:hypothetical protein FZEAL_1517 [Fusarium zealandicum]|uniref:Uncharacterized protein n=1 Tax=Fusarium zealandicum TaxID=1053134 RepID=A0A8H4USL4_9HYPO|nr:hypothetical protein FZEAL_1517 [Fusarium zealandicum]